MQEFLQDEDDMPKQPLTVVQAVSQRLSPSQATETTLQRTWNIMPNENPRRIRQFQPMTTVMENQPSQDDAENSSAA